MTTRKRFQGGVPASTLAGNIASGATSLTLATGTGASFPSVFPYDIIVNRASTTLRERVTVGGAAGDTLNSLTRGIDGTSGQAHLLGDTVELAVTGTFLDEVGQLLGGSAGNVYYYDGSALQKLTTGNARQRLISGTTPAWSYTSLPIYATTGTRDAEITAPVSGYGAYVDAGDATEGPYFYNGTSWRLPWNMPWGEVGYAEATGAQSGISAIADITNATVTFTAVGNRKYRVIGIASFQQVTNPGTATLVIADGSNTALDQKAATLSLNDFGSLAVQKRTTPAAGSTTYKLRLSSTAASLTMNSGATAPTSILVEDIGPSGAPT